MHHDTREAHRPSVFLSTIVGAALWQLRWPLTRGCNMLLTDNDRNALEACDENGVTNVGRIFALLDNFVEEGVQQGRF